MEIGGARPDNPEVGTNSGSLSIEEERANDLQDPNCEARQTGDDPSGSQLASDEQRKTRLPQEGGAKESRRVEDESLESQTVGKEPFESLLSRCEPSTSHHTHADPTQGKEERMETGSCPLGTENESAAAVGSGVAAPGNESMASLESTYTSLRDNGVEPTLQFR